MSAFVLCAGLLAACAFAWSTRRAWQRAGTPADPEAPSKRMLGALAALIVVVTTGGYGWVGTPAGLQLAPPASDGAGATLARGAEPVADTIARLARRLEQRPDDAAGWRLLARAYAASGRRADAAAAFGKGLALRPDDADLLVDYAKTLAADNESLEGEPARLIERALAADPRHLEALALSGAIAFGRHDDAGAAAAWERALHAVPPQHPLAAVLRDNVAHARRRAGSAPASPAAEGAAARAERDGTQSSRAAARAAAREGSGTHAARISGTVSLAPALAMRSAPEDDVFVFARAAQGPRVPLAVLRKKVRDLPFEFAFDDALAMLPSAQLSSAQSLIVGARISKSGQATSRPGDLQGSVGPVRVGTAGVKIEIREVVAQ